MTTSILDGIRASGHVYSLFQHFLMTIDVINSETMDALPVQALAMIRVWVQYLFSFVFVFNGITSGKWLTLNLGKDRSDLRVSIKFPVRPPFNDRALGLPIPRNIWFCSVLFIERAIRGCLGHKFLQRYTYGYVILNQLLVNRQNGNNLTENFTKMQIVDE